MKRKLFLTTILFLQILFLSEAILAQGPPPQRPAQMGGRKGPDPMKKQFYPPEMVMKQQTEINLSEELRNYIVSQMQEAQKNFTEWQWTLEAESDKLRKMTAQSSIKENEALLQLDKILALEKKIKTQQMKLLISVKNKLTLEQQKKLDELKKERGQKGQKKGNK